MSTSLSPLALQAQKPETGGESPALSAHAGPRRKGGASSESERGLSGLFSAILARIRSSPTLGELSPLASGVSAKNALSAQASEPDLSNRARDLDTARRSAKAARTPSADKESATGAARSRSAVGGTQGAARAGAARTGGSARIGAAAEAPLEANKDEGAAKARAAGREAAPGPRTPERAEQSARAESRRAAKAATTAEEAGSSVFAAAGAPKEAIPRTAKASQKSADLDSTNAIEKSEKPEKQKGSEPSVSVLDLRRGVEARRGDAAKRAAAATEDGAPEVKREQASGRNELVKTLEAGSGFGTAASDKAAGVPAGAAGPAVSESAAEFRALLAERLQESWNGEIVKSAHIVLRDGDSGTIRLRLKPESLGNVKIELNLSDNNISGKIVVESDEAKTAFERNMAELADAFRAGGFDSARLEVSVGSGSGGGAARDEGGSGPFYSERLRSASASSAQPATAQAAYARLGGSVDIFA